MSASSSSRKILFDVARGESEAVQPEQHSQGARDLQPHPTGAKACFPIVEHDWTRELQPECDDFCFASAYRRGLLPHPAYTPRAGSTVYHPAQRGHPAAVRARTHGQLFGYGLWYHDPIEPLE